MDVILNPIQWPQVACMIDDELYNYQLLEK